MKELNLFGQWEEVIEPKKTTTQANGYAMRPGTGPEGKRCCDCKHFVKKKLAKTYFKCGLARQYWTGGRATDVKYYSPACLYFKEEENQIDE